MLLTTRCLLIDVLGMPVPAGNPSIGVDFPDVGHLNIADSPQSPYCSSRPSAILISGGARPTGMLLPHSLASLIVRHRLTTLATLELSIHPLILLMLRVSRQQGLSLIPLSPLLLIAMRQSVNPIDSERLNTCQSSKLPQANPSVLTPHRVCSCLINVLHASSSFPTSCQRPLGLAKVLGASSMS